MKIYILTMSAYTVLSKDFDPSRVIFAKHIQDMNKGGTIKSCKVQYKYPDGVVGKLIIQTAKMRSPFGMSSGEKFNSPDKWSLQLSFDGEDNDAAVARFRKALESLEERVMQEAIARPNDVGGSPKFDPDDDAKRRERTVRSNFSSKISHPKKEDSGYSDTFKLSVPWDKDTQSPRSFVKFYDANNQETGWERAQDKGMYVVCLFEVSNVWSSNLAHNYGLTVRVVQMKMYANNNKLTGFQIKNEVEPDDKVASDDEESVASAAAAAEKSQPELVSDEDDDDESVE